MPRTTNKGRTTATSNRTNRTATRPRRSDAAKASNKPIRAASSAASLGLNVEPSQEQIAVQAYLIWQEKGCTPGRDEENWFEAVETLKNGKTAV